MCNAFICLFGVQRSEINYIRMSSFCWWFETWIWIHILLLSPVSVLSLQIVGEKNVGYLLHCCYPHILFMFGRLLIFITQAKLPLKVVCFLMQRPENRSENRTVHGCKYVSRWLAESVCFCSVIYQSPGRSGNSGRSYKSKPSCIFRDHIRITSTAKGPRFSRLNRPSGGKEKMFLVKGKLINQNFNLHQSAPEYNVN